MEQKTEQIQKEFINKDWTMGKILQEYPIAAEVMTKYGLHCVGCHIAVDETLEQGILGHGGTQEHVEKMINDLNQTLAEQEHQEPSTNSDIFLTDKAIGKIKDLLNSNQDVSGLRINVASGGCSGMSYEFSLVKEAKENEKVIEEKGIKIYINEESLGTMKGSKIDFIDALQGAGFKVTNPKATSTCGCGQSFS